MNRRDETATEWSLRTWKERHNNGYFPNSKEHAGWSVYPNPPEWLTPYLSREQRALEIGCGYAQWLIPVSRLVHHATGVDIHPEPVKKGIELLSDYDIENVHLIVSNGTSLPFRSSPPFNDSKFDLVYSVSVFQHLPRSIVAGYLRESVRVCLKGGGTIVHHFRNADNVGPYPPLATDIDVDHKGDFSVGWTADEVRTAAARAGMERVEVLDLGLFLVMVGYV